MASCGQDDVSATRSMERDWLPTHVLRNNPRGLLLVLLGSILAFSIWIAKQDMFFPVWDCCLSPDGTRLATLHGRWGPPEDGVIRLWDLESGWLLRSRRCNASSLMFSPDGRSLLSGNEGGSITVRDARMLHDQKTIQVDNADVWPMGFAEDGKTLIVFTASPKILLVDIQTGDIADPQVGVGSWRAIDGDFLLTADFDATRLAGKATVYEIDSGGWGELRSLPLSSEPSAVEISASGQHVAFSLPQQMRVLLWKLDGNKQTLLEMGSGPTC